MSSNSIDDILFFQSEPGSSNMLADWQIKQAKSQLYSLIKDTVIGEDFTVVTEYDKAINGVKRNQREALNKLFGVEDV